MNTLIICRALKATALAQTEAIMSKGRSSFLLIALVLLALALSSAAQAQRPEDEGLLQYRVKFVCGPADGRLLALGSYFTAINIHNPIQDEFAKPISLRVKFAVALPGLGQLGGHTDFTGFFDVTSDDAMELDCQEILGRTARLCPNEPPGFCKGFVVIESRAELDVIAVYTVADLNTSQATSLHADRITPHCPIRTEVVPQQTVLFVPPNVGGTGGADPDFSGNGPCVDFRLALQLEDGDKTLAAKYRMHAYECDGSFEKPQDDFTSAQGNDELDLKVASPRGRILGYDVDTSMSQQFIDSGHSDNIFSYGPPSPVERLRFVGDTGGNEAGTKTGVFITLRETRVELETCTPPPPTSSVNPPSGPAGAPHRP
jgi:hypothetical protein